MYSILAANDSFVAQVSIEERAMPAETQGGRPCHASSIRESNSLRVEHVAGL